MVEAWAAETAATTGQAGGSGGYWQLALILAGIGFLGLFTRWRKARTPAPQTARQIRQRDEEPNRYRDAADKALVELLETSRALNAQVDAKIRVLNRLVKNARDCAEKLEALLDEARAPRESAFPPTDAPQAATPAPASAAAPGDAPAGGDAPKRRFMSDLHERIYRLEQEGRSVAEIAKATNLSTTEVELFIKASG